MRSTIWKKTPYLPWRGVVSGKPGCGYGVCIYSKGREYGCRSCYQQYQEYFADRTGQKRGESRQRSDSMILATLDKDQRYCKPDLFL